MFISVKNVNFDEVISIKLPAGCKNMTENDRKKLEWVDSII